MTKIERAMSQRSKLAQEYVENQKHYLMHDYCMSADQLSMIKQAFETGFMKGLTFK